MCCGILHCSCLNVHVASLLTYPAKRQAKGDIKGNYTGDMHPKKKPRKLRVGSKKNSIQFEIFHFMNKF